MPSGRAHLWIEIALSPLILTAFHLVDTSWADLALLGMGYFTGSLFLTPDLDVPYSVCRRRWGILGAIWAPYSFFSRHRGLSHHPLCGPLIRIAYVALPLSIIFVFAGHVLDVPWQLVDPKAIVLLMVGVVVVNLIHVLTDRWWSSIRMSAR